MDRVVVVGAGLAGGRCCEELRSAGYEGEVVLVGAESHLPYDRPPLSKEVLAGDLDDTALEIPWDRLDVDVRLATVATGLREGVVETATGELPYDGLVLATGARPVTLPGDAGSSVLRTVDDARRLRSGLRPGARVVVVGAGWIGAEVATAAAAAGCEVVVVDAGPAPLAQAIGEAAGLLTVPWYAALGIDLRLSTGVQAVERDRVVLADGSELAHDVVVVGIGARPEVGWLESSGIALDRGVAVDRHLRASWPGVVALGDCAAWESDRYGTRLRVEHWDDALTAPVTAAANLLGGSEIHDPVPYFWSQQLGHFLQHTGHTSGGEVVVQRGEPGAADGWSTCWLRDDRLVAVLAVDRPRDVVQARKRIAAGDVVDAAALADPDTPVRAA